LNIVDFLPISITSILLAVFLVMFTGVFTALAVQELTPKLADDWYVRFDWWWRIVLYMVIFVGPLVLIVGILLRFMAPSFAFVKTCQMGSSGRLVYGDAIRSFGPCQSPT
jgi:hypothetical protein